jgi:hypothetical protein
MAKSPNKTPNVLTSTDHLFDPGPDASPGEQAKPEVAKSEEKPEAAAGEVDHLAAIVDLEHRLAGAIDDGQKASAAFMASEAALEQAEARHQEQLAALRADAATELALVAAQHKDQLAAATKEAHLQGYEQARGETKTRISKLRLYNVERTGPSGRQMVAASSLTDAIRIVHEHAPESEQDRVRNVGDTGMAFLI